MARLSMNKGTLMIRPLAGLIAAIALGWIGSLPAASENFSHRTNEIFFAKQDFSTWTPRKGKMTYERDSLQPEWGQGGRKRRYPLPCKRLAKHVGPNGDARHGDVILVVSDGDCNITRLAIHKAVRILSPDAVNWEKNSKIEALFPKGPVFNWLKGVDGGLAEHGKQFGLKINCQPVAFPCITVNIRNEGFASVEGFHIRVNNRLLAPLVESRSGGIKLKYNFIEGKARQLRLGGKRLDDKQQRQFGDDLATAILIHGSNAIIEKNTISGARTGIALLPSQRSVKGSKYEITRNRILNMELEAIHADGSIFMGASPRVKVSLIGNMIYSPVMGYSAKNVVSQIIHNNFNPKWVPKLHTTADPQNDIFQVENHMAIFGGSASIQNNVLRASMYGSIQAFQGAAIYVDNNAFGSNKKIFDGLVYAFQERSPFPSGNICRKQPLHSQYTGAPATQFYVDVNNGGVTTTGVDKKKWKRKRRSEADLWEAYQDYLDGRIEAAEERVEDRTGEKPKRYRSKKARYMWPAFESFYHRSKQPVFTHAMFARPDVDPADLYFACIDYSTIYRQTLGGMGGDNDDGFFGN